MFYKVQPVTNSHCAKKEDINITSPPPPPPPTMPACPRVGDRQHAWNWKLWLVPTPSGFGSTFCPAENLAVIFVYVLKSNLTCSLSTFTGQNELTVLVKALSFIVEGGQNYIKNQSKMPMCTFGSTVKNSQLTGFDHYSYLPLKL